MSTTPAQGWRPLSELVRDLRKIAAMAPLELVGELAQRPAMAEAMMPPPGPQRDQRTAALVLALRHQGLLGEPQTAQQWAVHDRALSVVLSQPALVDVAELALATGQHLVVHAMRPAATRVVHETDLHTLPGECSRCSDDSLRGGSHPGGRPCNRPLTHLGDRRKKRPWLHPRSPGLSVADLSAHGHEFAASYSGKSRVLGQDPSRATAGTFHRRRPRMCSWTQPGGIPMGAAFR